MRPASRLPRCCTARAPSTARGFTLVEAMVVMAIFGILVAIAAPNLVPFVERNRAWNDASALYASLSLARAEAARLNTPVGLCASADGATCDGAAWQSGWLVFGDTNGNGAFNGGEPLLQRQSALDGGTQVAATPAVGALTVQPTGRVSAGMTAGGSFAVTYGSVTRTVCLNIAGRTRLLQGGGPCA